MRKSVQLFARRIASMAALTLAFGGATATMVVVAPVSVQAQVTTGAMNGLVTDSEGKPVGGVRVVATHEPSGTKYGAVTGPTGRYNVQGLRTGGPYTVRFTSVGLKEEAFGDITAELGKSYVLNTKMLSADVKLGEVTVTSKKNTVMSNDRTGAATNISKETINSVPTLSRNIIDFAKVTPQANGRSFGGQDNRLNNLTIDGSVFNNSFGLSGVPGGQTGQSPISLDAIEEVQVNLAPYDVRQGNFTGAGINAITRSGDNQWRWSVFANIRNQAFAGDTIAGATAAEGAAFNRTDRNRSAYNVLQVGGRIGGPIIENKLFFFFNFEREQESRPFTNFRAARPGEVAGGIITRATTGQLDSLRNFLISRFSYDPGIYDSFDQPYSRTIFSNKATGKLDWNIDESNKISLRLQYLRSQADVITNGASNVQGARNNNNDALNFANANYVINNDIYSAIAEWNSVLSPTMSNNMIVGFTANRDFRDAPSRPFPFVDILQNGATLTSFGYELFTPFNKLNTDTWQVIDNFTVFAGDHTITAGLSFESFTFENGFNQRYYGYYRFASLQDFYNNVNNVAVGGRVPQPIQFSQTYSALPGAAVPIATTRAIQIGGYAQDEWAVSPTFKTTFGLRVDAPIFNTQGIENSVVSATMFRNNAGGEERLSTATFPTVNLLWSPRIGFNWDVNGDRSLQVRGGSGLFSGRPPFVWLSNVVTNNGVTAGEILENNPTGRPFNPDPAAYIPQNATTSVPPATFTVNTVVPGYRFPQVWRSNLAADIQLPLGLIATLEGLYTQNVAQTFYRDANLRGPQGAFTGADNRPRFPASYLLSGTGAQRDSANRVNRRITGNYVLDNTNLGNSFALTAQLQKPFSDGWMAMVAYTYSQARDITSAGSIAANSFFGNQIVGNPNIPDVSLSDNDNPHRIIANASYRIDFGEVVALTLSGFLEVRTQGRYSYTYAGDVNGDLIFNNDLIFVPASADQIAFEQFTATRTVSGVTTTKIWTPADQWTELDRFITSDPYLQSRRGNYAERNGALRGWVANLDLAATLDINFFIAEKRNTLQLRLDAINVTQRINPAFGVGDRVINGRPLTFRTVNAAGAPVYRITELVPTQGIVAPLSNTINFPGDVWQFQLGARWIFN
jgi:hypothetical protein